MERFNRAIKALVKGYMNDTLVKGRCTACAVGNIVAECMGDEIDRKFLDWGYNNSPSWHRVFMTNDGIQMTNHSHYQGQAKKEIDSTGYTWYELAMVEKAFECSSDMYDGLMKVIDVLCDIEGIKEVETYKEMFVK